MISNNKQLIIQLIIEQLLGNFEVVWHLLSDFVNRMSPLGEKTSVASVFIKQQLFLHSFNVPTLYAGHKISVTKMFSVPCELRYVDIWIKFPLTASFQHNVF